MMNNINTNKEVVLVVNRSNIAVYEIDEIKKTIEKIGTVRSNSELTKFKANRMYARLNSDGNKDFLTGLNVQILTADELQNMLVEKVF